MGIGDFIKSQFIEVIEWVDSNSDIILYRFPVKGKEIKMGAQLTVRESQIAVFVNEGVFADQFTPGRYQLRTENLPVLTKLNSWKYGFNSPFKAEVYFLNTKQFINQKWGTMSPILLKDPNFGLVRLRGFGNFSFKIIDAISFLREVSGTNGIYTTDGISTFLKNFILSQFTDVIGELKLSILDIPSNYHRIAELAKENINEKIKQYGVLFTSIVIQNISLPENVEKYIDKRSSMGAIGDLDAFTKFQTAEAIKDIANNPGGMAGIGAGLSTGMILGKVFGENAIVSDKQPVSNDVKKEKFCCNCGKKLSISAKFCDECGERQADTNICPKCGSQLMSTSKFCSECGGKIN